MFSLQPSHNGSYDLKKYLLRHLGMRQDWAMHVNGIHHRTLDRGMTLCVGQHDKEEAQNIQNIKCHDT